VLGFLNESLNENLKFMFKCPPPAPPSKLSSFSHQSFPEKRFLDSITTVMETRNKVQIVTVTYPTGGDSCLVGKKSLVWQPEAFTYQRGL
jgi:hypothetical protein